MKQQQERVAEEEEKSEAAATENAEENAENNVPDDNPAWSRVASRDCSKYRNDVPKRIQVRLKTKRCAMNKRFLYITDSQNILGTVYELISLL